MLFWFSSRINWIITISLDFSTRGWREVLWGQMLAVQAWAQEFGSQPPGEQCGMALGACHSGPIGVRDKRFLSKE